VKSAQRELAIAKVRIIIDLPYTFLKNQKNFWKKAEKSPSINIIMLTYFIGQVFVM
jgi:hypothetical protein